MKQAKPYINHIMVEIDFLVNNSEKLSYNEFIENEILKRSFVRSLEISGEATNLNNS